MTDQFSSIKKSLPTLGVGLGLRRELADTTFQNSERIDFVEFTPENYMDVGGAAFERLERAQELFSLVSHGLTLSVGSTDDLNVEYLKSLKSMLARTDVAWWSDHLCFAGAGGVYFHDLLPLPFSREAVAHVAKRVRAVQAMVDLPLLIENISYYMKSPGSEMSEAEFLSAVLEQADCGLLLDVNNVYVNSINHGFDAKKFLNEIPLERVVQVHIAGHKKTAELVIDTHGAAIVEPVYDLLRYVLSQTQVNAILLERDQNFPDFNEIMSEIAGIRTIVSEASRAGRSVEPTSLERSGQEVLA